MRVPFFPLGRENRYERQEIIYGKQGQRRLQKSKVVIIGLGALGSIVSTILVRSGVGNVHLVDGDLVEFVNLHRQFLYTEDDIGSTKAGAADQRLRKVNQDIRITYEVTEVNHQNIDQVIRKRDLVLDCTDNIYSRMIINDYCRQKKIPWVSASAVRDIGQVIMFLHSKNSPCYRCLHETKDNDMSCEKNGVLSSLTTMVGGMQAHTATQHLLGKQQTTHMLRIGMDRINSISLSRNQSCPLCVQKEYSYLEGKGKKKITKRGDSYHIRGRQRSIASLAQKLERYGKVDQNQDYLKFNNITVFKDGRCIIRASSKEEASALHSKYVEGVR